MLLLKNSPLQGVMVQLLLRSWPVILWSFLKAFLNRFFVAEKYLAFSSVHSLPADKQYWFYASVRRSLRLLGLLGRLLPMLGQFAIFFTL
jgi:hypothetical protein